MVDIHTNNPGILKAFEKYNKKVSKINNIKLCVNEALVKLVGGKKKIKYEKHNKKTEKTEFFNLKVDYLYDILNTIIQKTYGDEKKLVRLHSAYLRDKYGKYYNHYIDYLIKNKIIILTSQYVVGKQSKGYLLHKNSINSKSIIYKSYDKKLVKKSKEKRIKDFIDVVNYNRLSEKVIKHVIESFDYIKIDYDGALSYLKKYVTGVKLSKNLISIEAIHEDTGWFSVCDNTRCHTTYTIVKSEIRERFLTIEGEKTKEIDISNSQPFFLTLLMKDYLDELDWIDVNEFNRFRDLVKSGTFYKYFNEHCQVGNIKKKTFQVFFGENKYKTKVEKKFIELFPTIYEFILWYKDEEKKYQALANKLQKSESNFIFNNVLEEVIETYNDIKFFTVHDSIVVKESEYENVKKIFDRHIDIIHQKL